MDLLNQKSRFPQCDTLILLAVSSEEDALRAQAKSLGIEISKIPKHPILGSYYSLGQVGCERVIAVRSRVMGALAFGGSAELASRFRQATGATSIVQLGMAFGIDPDRQQLGDVLVSTHIIPYDHREYLQILGYTEVEAKAILYRSIEMYIDDRFSVTSRRRMGLL